MNREPKHRSTDLEPEELELVRRGGVVESVAERHARCPDPEMLMGLSADVLPAQLKDELTHHLARCGVCRVLARDLAEVKLPGISPEERSRIRARVFREIGERHPSWSWRWLWRPAPVVALTAAVVLVFVVGYFFSARLRSLHPLATTAREVSPSRPSVFQLEKPEVELPTVLIWRGGEKNGQQEFVADLGEAVVPYRKGDYQRAVDKLQPLERKYPRSGEVPFYVGVSEIFLGRYAEATRELERAAQLSNGDSAQKANWYLGMALERIGATAQAAAVLEKLCHTTGEYSARACAGLEELRSARGKPPSR